MAQGIRRGRIMNQTDEPGSFSWVIATNTLYGDEAVARLHGLDVDDVLAGLPLELYAERIHSADRPVVARAIHTAIVTGEPYRACFRITSDDMAIVTVVALGRCFRDHHGTPVIFSGIVFPAADSGLAGDTLLGQMITAHTAAIEEGNMEVAAGLNVLIEKLAMKRNGNGSYASH